MTRRGGYAVRVTSSARPLPLAALLLCLPFSACFPFEYYVREPALVKGVDMRQSIQVAADQIKKEGIEQGLSIWVLRDQYVTVEEAKEISDLYLAHIDTMKSDFNIWHTSWAIANLYKWGDASIKAVLEPAFQKATRQPERLTGLAKNSANNLINGEKITAGFIHLGGDYYAHQCLVVPGDKTYLQSYEDFRKKQK